jgi:hypothetical protein
MKRLRRLATVGAGALLFSLVSVPPAHAAPTVVAVAPAADTYTSSSAPTTDFGTSGSLAVYGSPENTAVLRFQFPAAPAGQVLTGASLRLRTTSLASAGSANTLNVRSATDTWSETGTFYANRPAVSGTLGSLPGGTVPNTTYDITLDPSQISGWTGSRTLAVTGTGTDSSWFWSLQASASLRPVLNLTYTGGTPPPPPAGGTATVLAVGDMACAPGAPVTSSTCRHGDVAALVASAAPDRFLALGDLQYQTGTLAEFLGSGSYNDTYGVLKAHTLPVLGNHEYGDNTRGYFDYFYGAGVTSGAFGTRPDGYSATTIGAWTFIALNSECDAGGVTGGCGVGSPQYQWLQSQLTNSPTACTLVATHHPRWSTGMNHGSYPALAPMWDLMAAHGVDVVVSAHNHVSEIFRPIGASGAGAPVLAAAGIRSFTAGGGGADLQSLTPNSDPLLPAMVARNRGVFGPLKLTLNADSYSWEFLPLTGMTFTNFGTTGSFSGTGSCH